MKKFLSLLVLVLVLFLVGCNINADVSKNGVDESKPLDSGEHSSGKIEEGPVDGDDIYAMDPSISSEAIYPGGLIDRTDGYSMSGTDSNIQLKAGQLTASATKDNVKYDFWKSLLTSNQEGEGIFQGYNVDFAFKTANRIALTFPKGTYAKVKLYNDDNTVFVGITDANGVCYVFGKEAKESYKITVEYLDKNNSLVTFDDEVTGDKEYDLEALDASRELIEIMFVIDATGSMGDEMRYLQAEITDVILKVKEANNNVRILLSVMVYRDQGDEYVTRYSDFTEDVNSQIEFLSKQKASGGGDFEEAVQTALTEACEKQWTSGNSTKILVHVADAPAHDQDVDKWNAAALKLAEMGVRVLTVASSGISKKTEYFFRCQSLITNGVYVHLTNDSGIGGDHIEATTEEKEEVELLNECLIRLINGFHTGDFGTAVNWRQSQTAPQS